MPLNREQDNQVIRQIVLDGINRRDRFISVEEADLIDDTLSRSPHRVPLFRHSFLSKNVSSGEFNRIYDQIFVDHSIMMRDVELLYNQVGNISRLIETKIIQPRLAMKTSISTIRNFIEAEGFKVEFNRVDALNMNSVDNIYPGRDRLEVDKASGSLKLPLSTSRVFSGEESIDVETSVITTTAFKYEESDISTLFSPSLMYYVALYAREISNPAPYENYNGVVVALDITLPGTIEINTLRIRTVSDVAQDVLSLRYSTSENVEEDGTEIEEIRTVSNGFLTEMEFDSISARKIRVVLGTKVYRDNTSETVIPGDIKHRYIESLRQEMREIQIEEDSITPVESAPYEERIRRSTKEPDRSVPPGARFYIMPLRDIEVSKREYQQFGSFRSNTRRLEGNLAFATVETREIESETAHIVKKLLIGGKPYTISTLDDDGRVRDVTSVQIDNPLVPEERYFVETNLIPNLDEDIEIDLLGEVIDPQYVDLEGSTPLPNGQRIYIHPDSGVSDGSVLSLRFQPAEFDRNGVPYDPRSVDVIEAVGKPNTRQPIYANRTTNYAYFYDTEDKIVRYHFDDTRISVNGELVIGPAATANETVGPNNENLTGETGQTVDGTVSVYTELPSAEENQGLLFRVENGEQVGSEVKFQGLYESVQEEGEWVWKPLRIAEPVQGENEILWRVTAPFFGFYDGGYVFIREEAQVGQNLTVTTQNPYVNNMLIALNQEGTSVPLEAEYDINYGERNQFTTATLKPFVSEGDSVSLIYMPIPLEDGSFPSSLENNIEQHSVRENFKIDRETDEIIVNRYPYIDPAIVNSERFVETNGIYYFKDVESIIYEPFIIFDDGEKLVSGEDYTVSGRRVSFNEPIAGNLQIRYYTLADSLGYEVEMLSIDPTRVDTTPRLTSILGLAKVRT